MKADIIKQEYLQFRERILELLIKLHELSVQTDLPDVRDVASGLVTNVTSPFLFVVVGEVKSGKSSFINSLLQEEICEVAPDPCTDTIQKIVHAEEPYTRSISEQVKEIGRPKDILKEIAIVDTPGTNSIIEQHQEITERFIPESDLVMFVFSAVNPYSRTAWELFELVHQKWLKKIIFILQQADRASEEELRINRERVSEYARSHGAEGSLIFEVSAKLAGEDIQASGIPAVWEYIRETVTGGKHYLYKMDSLLQTAGQVVETIEGEFSLQRTVLDQDKAEAERIRSSISRGMDQSVRETEILRARLLDAYSELAAQTTGEFKDGLSVGALLSSSMRGFFKRKNVFVQWLEGLTEQFNLRLTRKVDEISRESTKFVAETIVRSLESLLEDLRKSTAPASTRDWSISSMTKHRFSVIEEVTRNVTRLLAEKGMGDRIRPQGLQKIGDRALVGGFMTALGAVIAGAAHAAVFDVTGGILTTIGALLALNTVVFQRRSLVRRFRQGLEQGKERFRKELQGELDRQVRMIFLEVEEAFQPFFEGIEKRETSLAGLEKKKNGLKEALSRETERIAEFRQG